MKIQLVAKPGEGTTGLTRYSENLSQALRAGGLEVGVTLPEPVPAWEPARRGLRRLGLDAESFFADFPLRARLHGGDVYHLTPQTLATLLMVQRFDSPVVVTVQDIIPYLLRHDPKLHTFRHPLDSIFYRLALTGLKRADELIAVSEWAKQTLMEALGLPPEKIHITYPGIDHTFFYPRPPTEGFLREHGLSPQYRYILYVGSEQPRKNFLTLVRAFARVRRRVAGVRLVKVGNPESASERNKALELIGQLGVEREVLFCGHAGIDLPMFYAASALFVFPSFFEGFGFPPLEAMACGVPVICSNSSSLPEVVGDGALLFDPHDENALVELMGRMLFDPALQERQRRLGLERAAQFSWTATAETTIDVYRQATGRTQAERRALARRGQ